ncbi:MAG TPA: hypothetical protein V6D17_02460 [Candidatus Obscuribacterales bacterium]
MMNKARVWLGFLSYSFLFFTVFIGNSACDCNDNNSQGFTFIPGYGPVPNSVLSQFGTPRAGHGFLTVTGIVLGPEDDNGANPKKGIFEAIQTSFYGGPESDNGMNPKKGFEEQTERQSNVETKCFYGPENDNLMNPKKGEEEGPN